MMTPTVQELRELVKEAHHLLDRLKDIKDPTEAGTATTPAQDPTHAGQKNPKGLPWAAQQVRATMGFDPNDENVKVVFKTNDGVEVDATATVTPQFNKEDQALADAVARQVGKNLDGSIRRETLVQSEQDDTFAADTRVIAVPEPLFWEMVQALTRNV